MIKKLSILIPVFNEEKTILKILERVDNVSLQGIKKEVIVIDDGSTDQTLNLIKKNRNKFPNLILISQATNQGKGSAVKRGIDKATGDYIIIQDGDLEYNPQQIPSLLKPIHRGEADVVYGTRLNKLPDFKHEQRTFRFALHYFGNRLLSLLTSILYWKWITDMETGYKVFPTRFAKGITLKAKSFDFEPEITSKIFKSKLRVIELPIKTNPRPVSEGKKLDTVTDGFAALVTTIVKRFSD